LRYGIADTHSYCDTNSNSYADTHSYPFGNAYSHDNAYPFGNAYSHDNAYTDTNSYSDSAATYTNANGNNDTISYGDTYTDANRKSIWECMSAADDDRPHQGTQHTVQFHSISKPH